ncbi:hypothetical protein ILUMI_11222 [Ignelater luminosus]|uniref:Immunoglobulin-binding protein 1 n=1 Tax=Ignelater luminosus TaxID=2038154 RepID=A0A8K0CWM8_IGNLU|nr:hypothetical protein ILUMI_11222 [Ignelater luminosus]
MASNTENDVSSNQNSDTDTQTLLSLFEEGLDLYNNLGKIDEPTNSPNVQSNVNKAIRMFEDATRLVSLAGLFSTNEDVEEIPTEHLRYLLLPALLGSLCLKLTSRGRKDVTEVAEAYYKDFLQRCNNYNLSDYKFKNTDADASDNTNSKSKKSEFDEIKDAVNTRAGKIQRFKEQKELQNKLEDLKKNMSNENVDDEIKRNYFLTMIKLFIYEAVDELGSIETEKQILEHMSTLNQDDKPKSKRPPPQPLKPVIITKDAVQKAVFGAGYPSLPVMSVEEFYDKRVREGIFPDPAKKPITLQDVASAGIDLKAESEEELKEKKIEEDDPELLEEMRSRDEFKDDHRRGWGNRMNRS